MNRIELLEYNPFHLVPFIAEIQLTLQAIFSNLNWTCLLIPLKYMENHEQSGQVQLRLEKIACILYTRGGQPKLIFGPQIENFAKNIGFLGRMLTKIRRNTPKMSKNC